ncbi:MAG: ABC transporter permease [Bacteroidota bacterium]
MFDLDKWQEIFITIRQNPLRSFLTSFSVGWGILMLVTLLGLGKGLENGVKQEFQGDAINSIWIFNGKASLPHKGLQPGRDIRLTVEDYQALMKAIPNGEAITARFSIPGGSQVTYQNQLTDYNVRSVHPGHQQLENSEIVAGRYLNQLDLDQSRKVALVGRRMMPELFKGQDPIGEQIEVNGVAFKVVGVYGEESEREEDIVYLPITTAMRAFGGDRHVNQIMFTVGDMSVPESEALQAKVTQLLAQRKKFDLEDPAAIRVRNNVVQFQQFMNIMAGIRIFVWFIASGTILAGIIGVSNIMVIVVKERTKEFGVRKALGATPASVVGLIMQESIFITTVAGYIGLLLGVTLINALDQSLTDAVDIFASPEINLNVALTAMVLLVIAGSLAGLIPALRAARIRPIEALREE